MKELLLDLNIIYQSVRTSEHSSFYRDYYANNGAPKAINALADWQRLPLLTKAEIITVPFKDRLFVDHHQVDMLRATSGTSGADLMVFPRSRVFDYRSLYSELETSGFIVFMPAAHTLYDAVRCYHTDVPFITGDLSEATVSLQLAKQAGVNCLVGFTYVIDALLPTLQQYDMCEQFTFLHFFGECLTKDRYQSLQQTFPNAQIVDEYGLSELQGPILINQRSDADDYAMQLYPGYYLELIDPDTEAMIDVPHQAGELVISTLWLEHNDLPLLRYRTGDMALRVSEEQHGPKTQFRILGRADYDRIKLLGGEFNVAEIERVLAEVFSAPVDYEVHVSQVGTQYQARIIIFTDKDIDSSAVSVKISTHLRLSPTSTYETKVTDGDFRPLTLETQPLRPITQKRRRLFKQY